jgi:hypothetical protein
MSRTHPFYVGHVSSVPQIVRVAAIVALTFIWVGMTGNRALAALSTSSCPTSYDANTASVATLQACGDTYVPLGSVTALADGGHSYNYDGEGLEVSYLVPPASFDPATASAAELKAYGLEAPPDNSPQGVMWNKMINNMHFKGTPPSRLVFLSSGKAPAAHGDEVPALDGNQTVNGAQTSLNWSGYGDYSSYQQYNKATAYFVQPKPFATCFNAEISVWDGLGGWNSKNLAQNGTADGVPGISVEHQAWWEILPAGMVTIPEHATPGSYFEAQTHYEGYSEGRSHFNFYVYNYADGSWWSTNVRTTYGVDRSTAEYIVERPAETRGGKTYMKPLESYSPISFQGFTEGNALASYPYNYTNMEDRAHAWLATVEGIPPSSYLFSDIYHTCGPEEEF